MAVQVIYVPLFSLFLVFILISASVFTVLLLFVCYFIFDLLFLFYFVSSLPWEGGPQVVLICWPEPHGLFLMPSRGLTHFVICYFVASLFASLCLLYGVLLIIASIFTSMCLLYDCFN